jgi:uncharacterized membrane protein
MSKTNLNKVSKSQLGYCQRRGWEGRTYGGCFMLPVLKIFHVNFFVHFIFNHVVTVFQ